LIKEKKRLRTNKIKFGEKDIKLVTEIYQNKINLYIYKKN